MTQPEEKKNTVKWIGINFADQKLPKFAENKNKGYCSYGEKNDYPEKLIELFNRSPKHNAILSQKVKFINGKEIVVEGQGQEKVIRFNNHDSMLQFRSKVWMDKKLAGCYAIEVVYDRLRRPTFYHLDFSKVRTLDHSSYQYWKDGSKTKPADIVTYAPYDPDNLETDESGLFKKQIIYYREYRPGLEVYALPDYIGAIQYIEVDTRIANFHLNNITNGFTGGTLLQLFKDEPTAEEARAAKRKFKEQFQGDDGRETGGLIIQWNKGNETPSVVTPLTPNNLDEQFLRLNEHVQQEIFVGHRVTSPMLFGVRQEGQLGGRNEMADAYEIYYRSQIEPEQEEADRLMQYLMNQMGFQCTVKTTKAEPIGQDWVSLFGAGLAQKEHTQEQLGIPVDEVPQISETQKLTEAINSLSPLVANKVLNELTTNEVRALAGLPPVPGGEAKSQTPAAFSAEDEISIFASFGEDESLFEFETADEKKILTLLNENPKLKPDQIAEQTQIELPEVNKLLKALEKSNKIEWTNKAVKITDDGKDLVAPLVLRWKYDLAPEAPPLQPGGTSRPFCKKLMALGRVYSREDIDELSARLGYDVWSRRGGWYHNPEKDANTPQCRHIWKQVILRRK